MELVYLWVEEYKNIRNQGFNFSPRFTCKYENGELLIEGNKDYVSIFPPNINVTAIVGENGSGKSNLIELIIAGIFQNGLINQKNANWREIKNLFYIFIDNNKYKIYIPETIPFNMPQSFLKLEVLTFQDILKKYFLLLDFSIMQHQIWNDDKDYKVNFSLEPSRDYLTGGPESLSKISPTAFDAAMKANAIYFYKYATPELCYKMNIQLFDVVQIKYKKAIQDENKIKEEITYAEKFFKQKNYFLNCTTENFNQRNFRDIKPKELLNITDEEMDAISYFAQICHIELFNSNNENMSFYKLSTGTQILLSYFGIICKTIIRRVETKKDDLIIFIDEIENSLHPNWQKHFLSFLLIFLQNWNKSSKLKIHLILITHSPFFLSDLHTNNIIFISRSTEGFCQVIDGLNTKKQTFGANIHTLLSDAFFIQDGLMGEFSKNKINEVIEYLNKIKLEPNEIKYCEEIISIIGEPILKRQLQKMLDSKRLAKIDKIDSIQKQIKALEEELKKVRR